MEQKEIRQNDVEVIVLEHVHPVLDQAELRRPALVEVGLADRERAVLEREAEDQLGVGLGGGDGAV